MTAALLSRLLGLLRDRIFASRFGAGDDLDIYFAAFRIPDFIFNLLIAGAIASALIPVFLEIYKRNEEEAWEVVQNFFNVMATLMVCSVTLAIIFMPLLVRIIAPGFAGDKYQETVLLSRIMMLSPFLLGISAILSGINQSFRQFLPYALAPLLYNASIIAGVLFLVPVFGLPGLALGVVAGAAIHFLIQVPPAYASGFHFAPSFSFRNFSFAKIFKLMVPRAIGLAGFQINISAMVALASLLAAGSVTLFNFADNLQYVVIGIVGISYATASFTTFSHKAADISFRRSSQEPLSIIHKQEYEEFVRTFVSTTKQILFFTLPLSAILFAVRIQVVRVILGSGRFNWEDTRLTAAMLGIFCFGICAQSLIPMISRAFYAAQNTILPVSINLTGIVFNIILSIILVFASLQDGFADFMANLLHISDLPNIPLLGLPLAFAISGICTALALFYAFFRRYGRRKEAYEILASFVRIAILSVFASLTSFVFLRIALLIPAISLQNFYGVFFQGLIAGIAGLLIYGGGVVFLRFPERDFLVRVLTKELPLKF